MRIGRQYVDEYITASHRKAQPMLRQLRRAIRASAPKAVEGTSYGMPYYADHGRLVYFAAFANHISLFVPGRIVKDHAAELAKFKTSQATIQFPIGTKVPVTLVRKLVKARARENERKSRKAAR